ncbi:MAG TPA: hypothetical protein VGV14_13130 [Rhodanobacter sp.]|nr:hypothetical protein [Rhodanobacter sp.]
MQPTRAAAFTAMLAAVTFLLADPAHAGGNRHAARHFDVVNATLNSVTALAIAPAGSEAFHDIALGEPLQGRLASITVDVPDGGCLRDIRVTFRNGRTLLYPRVDACRYQGLRLMPRDGNPQKMELASGTT